MLSRGGQGGGGGVRGGEGGREGGREGRSHEGRGKMQSYLQPTWPAVKDSDQWQPE